MTRFPLLGSSFYIKAFKSSLPSPSKADTYLSAQGKRKRMESVSILTKTHVKDQLKVDFNVLFLTQVNIIEIIFQI